MVAIALLWLFAPTTLGGNFAYVTITGNSMEPLLETGDLVLLRQSSDYDVGEAVAYRHPQIGTVLHRIVEDDGQRFTLRGDNRAGEDTFQPAPTDVIGSEWLVVPNGGRVIKELQQPRNLGLLVVAAALLWMRGSPSARRRVRRRLRAVASVPHTQRDLSIFSQSGRQLAAGGAILAVGSVALLALFAINGTTRESAEVVPFVERGSFVYGGTVEGGVYDDNQLAAPEPLYRQLIDELPIQFNYELTPASADSTISGVTGTYELVAEVGTDDGWTRTYPLGSPTPFAGPGFNVAASIDLSALEADLAQIAELTGIASMRHVVRVFIEVEAAGQIDELPFATDYRHLAQFRLGPLQLQFDGTPDSLTLAEDRTVSRPITEARTLSLPLLPLTLRYAQFPLFGALGLAVASLIAAYVARGSLATWRSGEAARIRATYQALLVEIAEERAAFGSRRPQDVSRFEDLVRLAAAEGLAIMHRSGYQDDEYFVATADRSWRYAIARPATEARPEHPEVGAPGSAAPEVDARFITTGES